MYARESAKDDLVSCRQQAIDHIDRIAEFATEAARLASRDTDLLQFRPSVLATAAVVCGRKMLEVEPHFSKALSDLSGCGGPSEDVSSDLGLCCEKLIRLCGSGKMPNSQPATSPLTAHAAAMEDVQAPSGGATKAGKSGPIRWPLQDLNAGQPADAMQTQGGPDKHTVLNSTSTQPQQKWENGSVLSYQLDQQIFGEFL